MSTEQKLLALACWASNLFGLSILLGPIVWLAMRKEDLGKALLKEHAAWSFALPLLYALPLFAGFALAFAAGLLLPDRVPISGPQGTTERAVAAIGAALALASLLDLSLAVFFNAVAALSDKRPYRGVLLGALLRAFGGPRKPPLPRARVL